ncbi:metallo-beta-lactamase superfamily protein [Apiospora arundinis]
MSTVLANCNTSVFNDYLAAQGSKLPVLPPVEQVSPRVVRILGGNAGPMRLQGTNTYLVGTGKSRILIDAGQGLKFWIDNLRQLADELDITISHVLLTHWHIDHTSGVPDLVACWPELAERIYKLDPDPGQRAIVDGQEFAIEGATLRAVHTPGHSHDHVCFQLAEEDALFTGDNVLGHGQSVFEDLGLFTTSLGSMAALGCHLGYPAHGALIEDLPRKMQGLLRQKEYYEHQVYSFLTAARDRARQAAGVPGPVKGSVAVTELVTAVFGRAEGDVVKLAIEPQMVKTLEKLAEDRKVAFEIVAGEKRWFARDSNPRGRRGLARGGMKQACALTSQG